MIFLETKDAYIYHFIAPEIKGQKLNVEVSDQGITIEGDYIQQAEKTDAKDNMIARTEQHGLMYEHFPISD